MSKTQVGDLINAAMEFGGDKLVDKLSLVIGLKE
jgi:hypothetical protein